MSRKLSEKSEMPQFTIVYRKLQHKKNKTWESDGYLKIHAGQTIMFSQSMETIQTKNSEITIEMDKELRFGNYELMIEEELDSLPSAVDDILEISTNKENASLSKLPKIQQKQMHLNKKLKPLDKSEPKCIEFKLDAFLNKLLRDHQKEGVEFMFKSILGYQSFAGNGCILADDMGLGKSLQAISLIWAVTSGIFNRAIPFIKNQKDYSSLSSITGW